MGAVVSWVWNAAPCPDELMEARIAERFHLSPNAYEREDKTRLLHWYYLLAQMEIASSVKEKMSSGQSLTDSEGEWRKEYWDWVPTTFEREGL